MSTYIILLRGINVGGKNVLPMAGLKVLLESNGFKNVQTYIQSGNVVLVNGNSPEMEIGPLILSKFGFTPEVMVLSKAEFESSISNNPYQKFEGKFVHFYFCKKAPKLNSLKLDELSTESESYKLVGKVFYLHAPDGIGRSKLVAGIEKCLGVSATGRNLNTVSKLNNMAQNA